MSTSQYLCMYSSTDAKDKQHTAHVVSMEKAQPHFQARGWSSKAHNYVGPYWEITDDSGQRIRTGVHIIPQTDLPTIEAYVDDMFCQTVDILPPIKEIDSFSWGCGKNCVAMSDGSIYEITINEGKPQVRLFPALAPKLQIEAEPLRDRHH